VFQVDAGGGGGGGGGRPRGRAAGCRGVPEQRGGLGGPAACGALARCAWVSVVGKLWSGSLTGLARPACASMSAARPPCVWHKHFVAARYAGSRRAAPWLTLRSGGHVPHRCAPPTGLALDQNACGRERAAAVI